LLDPERIRFDSYVNAPEVNPQLCPDVYYTPHQLNITPAVLTLLSRSQLNHIPNKSPSNDPETVTMSSNSLNYPLLAIPAYYVFSLVPHIYAASLLTANGYKINNANPKAALSPEAVKGKVPDAV